MKLLGQVPISWGVFLGNCDEGISVCRHGGHYLCKKTLGIAAVVFADCDIWVYVLKEREGGGIYVKIVAGFPLGDGIVQKFCCSGSNEIPITLVQ